MNDIGFVYEWTDISNGKKYIGSHKGTPDDGYTGSGKIFKTAYKKRPQDFVRTILYSGTDYRNVEEKILLELNAANNKNYYNLKNICKGVDIEICRKSGIKCRDNKLGFHSFSKKERTELAKKLYHINKKGIGSLTDKQLSEFGKKGGNTTKEKGYLTSEFCKKGGISAYEKKVGIHSLTKEQRKLHSSKCGTIAKLKKAGIFGMSKEERLEASRKGGQNAKLKNATKILLYKKDSLEFYKEYLSQHDAAKDIGCDVSQINMVLKNRCKSVKGYIVKYK